MYRMDLDTFREQIKGCKLFILCNPHNPGGVVSTEAELRAIADICYDEKVLVFSDEIRADLTYLLIHIVLLLLSVKRLE